MKKNNKITIEQLQKELEFLNTKEFQLQIINLWEEYQDLNIPGFIQCFVDSVYKGFLSGYPRFKKGRVKKSTFLCPDMDIPINLKSNEEEAFALVQFYWAATQTYYRVALRYIRGYCIEWDLTFKN